MSRSCRRPDRGRAAAAAIARSGSRETWRAPWWDERASPRRRRRRRPRPSVYAKRGLRETTTNDRRFVVIGRAGLVRPATLMRCRGLRREVGRLRLLLLLRPLLLALALRLRLSAL